MLCFPRGMIWGCRCSSRRGRTRPWPVRTSPPVRRSACTPTHCRFNYGGDKYASGERLDARRGLAPGAAGVLAGAAQVPKPHALLSGRQGSEPRSRAVAHSLLDLAGNVLETSIANILVYHRARGLTIPPAATVLPGVSLAATLELAVAQGISVSESPLTVSDVESADEVLLASTTYCLLPVTRVNATDIGGGRPGEIYATLLAGWNGLAGIDIVEQARGVAIETR